MAAFLASRDYWWGWGDLVFRWLHVVAGIAWIGSSFYFIALDHHLEPPKIPSDAERGVGGEVWEIHGGGFYRIEKFKVAPERLPEKLYWFKWEAYTTWLSGFALLTVVYYAHASTFLVDPSVADITTGQAIALSIGGLALAWIVYDALCRLLGFNDRLLAVCVGAFVVLAAWGAGQLFAPRAAYIEVGAMLGTIMAANVFFVIIPNHWKLVRAKEAGEEPDPAWNAQRQAAVGAQQLLHAAGRLRDALEPLPVHLRARPRLADPRRPDGARRADPPLLQPPPQRPERLVDPRGRRGRAARARARDPAAVQLVERVRPGAELRDGRRRSSPTAARPATRCTRPSPATPRRRRGSSSRRPSRSRQPPR